MFDHFDWLAPIYDRVIGPPDVSRLQRLLKLPVEGVLLDAGGGTGRVSSQLLPLVNRVVLSDLSQPMLRQAQAKGPFHSVQAVVQRLPFPDDYFERVLVVDALHHFGDQPGAVRELLRMLRPGGRLVIEEPNIHHFGVKVVALIEKLTLMGSHFHSPVEIRDMIAAYGLSPWIADYDGVAARIVVDK